MASEKLRASVPRCVGTQLAVMTKLRTERLLRLCWRDFTREESDEVMDRYESSFKENGFGRFAVERGSDHAFLGMVGILIARHPTQQETFIDIGWRLSPAYWGHGFATEAAREVVRYAFEDLKLGALVALAAEANTRSVRIMQKLTMAHDPADDFDEPRFPPGHFARRHVLYRLRRTSRGAAGRTSRTKGFAFCVFFKQNLYLLTQN